MPNSLKKWIKRKMFPRKKQNCEHPPPAPPFRTEWPNISAPNGDLASNYGLFQKLPVELRQQILGYAFGNRTIHIHLEFGYPFTRKQLPARKSSGATNSLRGGIVRNDRRPQQWQWFSCVCHRRVIRPKDDNESVVNGHAVEAWEDACIPSGVGHRSGYRPPSAAFCECKSPDRSSHDECLLGVFGWLLASRQAYLDGMDVLFRTNTFHISSLPLLLDLPQLLPPRYLPTITSLELLWTFADPSRLHDSTMTSIWDRHIGTPPTSESVIEPTKFHRLCDLIPTTFPHLRRLYISMQAYLPPPDGNGGPDIRGAVETLFIHPIEDVFRTLGPAPGKEFSLAIQQGGWKVFAQRWTEGEPGSVEQVGWREKVWKPLGLEEGAGGYWLCWGWDDFEVLGSQYWLYNLWGLGVGLAT
ncbi:uncharacterized protein C8A04DRAFT_12584 [Dichotomopilus funicola]|uniref:DUF7730 domain-containing protein n=1 Tax=Dichotomopilus funicola TaxID=1934379 RepID=A0AAN6V1S2_9PEZI|nr:hypothetical protein C8A04DRAFT_12584 [Dichotomopilus funicola]